MATHYRPLKFASLNAFLIPWIFTFKNNKASSVDQAKRAGKIVEYLKEKDVAALQEVWGSQVYTLQSGLESTHDVPKQYRSTNLWGFLANFFDMILFWFLSLGGLWMTHKKDVKVLWSGKHVFTVSETSSRKGVSCNLLDVGAYWPDKYLLVFNTHLDPHSQESKLKQINEIHEFISTSVNDINAARRAGKLEVDLLKCGVIVVGDFNIQSGSRLYNQLLSIFKARDFFKEANENKNSKGEETLISNSFDCFSNSIAGKNGEQFASRIDYIFGLDFYYGSAWQQQFMPLNVKECHIVQQAKGEELSDHYPIECLLEPKN